MGQPRQSHLKEFQVWLGQQRQSLGIRMLYTNLEALPAGFVSAHRPEERSKLEGKTQKGHRLGTCLIRETENATPCFCTLGF